MDELHVANTSAAAVGSLTSAIRIAFETSVLHDSFFVPPKIRQLLAVLERRGFEDREGKGSHWNFVHPSGVRITISGRSGDDAKHYQERDLKRALEQIRVSKPSDRYVKVLAWSEEDQCYVGRC